MKSRTVQAIILIVLFVVSVVLFANRDGGPASSDPVAEPIP